MAWNGIFYNGVWSCGFDMSPVSTEVFDLAFAGAVNATTAFGTGLSWDNSGTCTRSLGVNLTTIIVGFRMQCTLPVAGASALICTFFDNTAGAGQVSLRIFSDGSFKFFLSTTTTTQLGSTSAVGLISNSTWIYLEATVTISATVGVVELRVNGNTSPVISNTGLNTKSTANTFINAFQFSGPNPQFIDDWYMLDTTGSSPLNTYLGNVRVAGDVASGAGSHTQWAPTTPTGVNFSNTTSIPAVTTKFNSDATVGDIDSYAFPSITGSPSTVLFVNHWYKVELDSSGTRTVVPGVRSGGSDTFDTTPQTPPNGTYKYFNKPWTVDPNTSSAWTVSNAAAAEFSVKINS